MCWLYIQNCGVVINIRTSWKIMPIFSCYWLDKKIARKESTSSLFNNRKFHHFVLFSNNCIHNDRIDF